MTLHRVGCHAVCTVMQQQMQYIRVTISMLIAGSLRRSAHLKLHAAYC